MDDAVIASAAAARENEGGKVRFEGGASVAT